MTSVSTCYSSPLVAKTPFLGSLLDYSLSAGKPGVDNGVHVLVAGRRNSREVIWHTMSVPPVIAT